MADQYKTSMASKQWIKPLPTVTLTAGPDTLLTINLETFTGSQIKNIIAVMAGCTLAGATTLIWYGGTTTSGGTLTAIATLTLTSAHTAAALQIDAEDIAEAAEGAELLPDGFKSLVLKIDGANNDVFRGCVVANCLHEKNMLTPSDVVALT